MTALIATTVAVSGAVAALLTPPPYASHEAAIADLRGKAFLPRYHAARYFYEDWKFPNQVRAESIPALAAALCVAFESESAEIRWHAVIILSKLAEGNQIRDDARPACLRATLRLLTDPSTRVRRHASFALARLDPAQTPVAVASLKKLCAETRDREFVVTVIATYSLKGFTAEQAAAMLAARFDEFSDDTVGSVCNWVLTHPLVTPGADSKLVTEILGASRSHNKSLRYQAFNALVQIAPQHHRELVEPISEMLKEEETVAQAAEWLADIGEPAKKALPALREAFEKARTSADPSWTDAFGPLLVALARLDPELRPGVVAALRKLLALDTERCDFFVVRSLAQMGDAAGPAVADLVRLTSTLKDPKRDLPLVLDAFRKLGPTAADAGPLLKKLTQHDDPAIRKAAEAALRAVRP